MEDRHYSIAIQQNTDEGLGRALPGYLSRAAELVESYLDEQDQIAIRNILTQQAEAWNNGDMEGYLAGYYPDERTVMISSSGVRNGFEEIAARYRKSYPAGQMGELDFDQLSFEALRPDLYQVLGRYHVHYAGKRGSEAVGLRCRCRRSTGNGGSFAITPVKPP